MSGINITDAIFAQAAVRPDAVAVIDGDSQITYAELCASVCASAERILGAGLVPGDVAGIATGGAQALHLVIVLALARAGIAQFAVPAGEHGEALRVRLKRFSARGLIACDAIDTALGVITVEAHEEWLDDRRAPGRNVRTAADELLWLISETSGTTGIPKLNGVTHRLEDIRRQRQFPVFAHPPGERYFNFSRIQFSTAIKRAIRCLSDGATMVFAPPALSLRQLMQWLTRCNVRNISCVPVHIFDMLKEAAAHGACFPELRVLRCGAATLPVSALEEARRVITPNIYISYGVNEIDTVVAATPDVLARFPECMGRPLSGVFVEIVDDEDRPLPPGSIGNVRISGAGVQSTYVQAPEDVAARVFRGGWCYPGDLGCLNEEGLLFLKGRVDDVINFDGLKIGPAEIESVLRTHPLVQEVAAFGIPHPGRHALPAAAVVSKQLIPPAELGQFAQARLGARAPLVYLWVQSIPRNPIGKVLRRQLVELALAQLARNA